MGLLTAKPAVRFTQICRLNVFGVFCDAKLNGFRSGLHVVVSSSVHATKRRAAELVVALVFLFYYV